jgi:hypothetical protein
MDPVVANLHRDLLRRWIALVGDPQRRLDEKSHVEMCRSWNAHEKQNLRRTA